MKKLSIIFVSLLFPLLMLGQQYWDDIVAPMTVNDVLETNTTIWMATDGGLIEIDKQTKAVSQFTKAKNGLPSNSVEGIAMDNAGNLWIGTYTMTLTKYDGSTWTNIDYPASFPTLKTHSIRIDQNDIIWAGTSAGLVKYDGTNWELFNSGNTGVNFFNDAWNIVFDQQGNLFTISSTVIKFDGTNWTDISIGTGVTSYGGAHMEILNNGTLMFGNLQGNVVAFYDTTWTIYSTTNGDFPAPGISEIAQDANGNAYIAVQGSGVYKLQNGTWNKEILPTSTINENEVSTMFFDKNNNLWLANDYDFVAMESNGNDYLNINVSPLKSNSISKVVHHQSDVFVLNGATLSQYSIGTGWTEVAVPMVVTALNTDLTNMIITETGEYWLTSNYGELYHWNGQTWATYTYLNSALPIASLNSIVWNGQDQSLWIASSAGVIKFKNQQFTVYSSSNTIMSKDRANQIAIQNGVMYVAVDEYLYSYNGITWADISPTNPEYITSLYLNGTGNIWTGHWSGGVRKYENGTWNSISTLQNEKVTSMVEDQNNIMYFGTEDDGLIQLDGTNWTYFTEGNSRLTHNSINDLSIDTNNELWISTVQGIGIYNASGTVSDETILVENEMDLKVFPNPIINQATVQFTLKNSQKVRMGIYDINGRLVQAIIQNETQTEGQNTISFSKGNLVSGMYLIKLELENDIETMKILIQ